MGLTEEITPAKSYTSDDSGLTTKNNIFNNRSHNWLFKNEDLKVIDIITSTSQTLEGYEIKEHLGITSEHGILQEDDIQTVSETQKHLYKDLLIKIKSHALSLNGNGITGVNYTVTPLLKQDSSSKLQYKITCTGNVVWLLKI